MTTILIDNRLKRLNEVIDLIKKSDISLNQRKIADDLGYKRETTISEIVNGKINLSTKFVKAFCQRYGVNEDYIESGAGSRFAGIDLMHGQRNEENTTKEVEEENKDDVSSHPSLTNEVEDMTLDRAMRIAERLSIAIEQDAHTKRDLAKTLARMMDYVAEGRERVVVKQTGD